MPRRARNTRSPTRHRSPALAERSIAALSVVGAFDAHLAFLASQQAGFALQADPQLGTSRAHLLAIKRARRPRFAQSHLRARACPLLSGSTNRPRLRLRARSRRRCDAIRRIRSAMPSMRRTWRRLGVMHGQGASRHRPVGHRCRPAATLSHRAYRSFARAALARLNLATRQRLHERRGARVVLMR